jgi:hypothetical protein
LLPTSVGDEVTVGTLTRGNSFGEQGLLTSSPRNFTIRATSDLALLRLDKKDFESLIGKQPGLREYFSNYISEISIRNFLKLCTAFAPLSPQEIRYLLNSMQGLIAFIFCPLDVVALDTPWVRAPITGFITHRYVALGTNVARNEKLFEVSKLSPLQLKFQLPRTEKNKPVRGQIIRLSALNDGQVIATARIRRIDPVADATTNTFCYLADVVGGDRTDAGFGGQRAFATGR